MSWFVDAPVVTVMDDLLGHPRGLAQCGTFGTPSHADTRVQ